MTAAYSEVQDAENLELDIPLGAQTTIRLGDTAANNFIDYTLHFSVHDILGQRCHGLTPGMAPPPPPPPPPRIACVGHWGEWGPCDADCAGGNSFRTFSISVRAADGGQDCEAGQYDQQRQDCNPQPCPLPLVAPVVETVTANTMDGYTTIKLLVALGDAAGSIYTIFGEACSHGSMDDCEDVPLSIPPAYQTATPFGANTGGTNPQFWAFSADAQWDSWLTVGLEEGDPGGLLSSIGIDFVNWSETTGIVSNQQTNFPNFPDT